MIRLAVAVGRRHKAGAVIEEGEISPALLADLLARGLAERVVGEGEVSPELTAAIGEWKAAAGRAIELQLTLLAQVEAGGPAAAIALVDAMEALENSFPPSGFERQRAIYQLAKDALRAPEQREVGGQTGSDGTGLEAGAAGEAAPAGPDAAREGTPPPQSPPASPPTAPKANKPAKPDKPAKPAK